MPDLKNIKEEYNTKLNSNLSLEEINQIKTDWIHTFVTDKIKPQSGPWRKHKRLIT